MLVNLPVRIVVGVSAAPHPGSGAILTDTFRSLPLHGNVPISARCRRPDPLAIKVAACGLRCSACQLHLGAQPALVELARLGRLRLHGLWEANGLCRSRARQPRLRADPRRLGVRRRLLPAKGAAGHTVHGPAERPECAPRSSGALARALFPRPRAAIGGVKAVQPLDKVSLVVPRDVGLEARHSQLLVCGAA